MKTSIAAFGENEKTAANLAKNLEYQGAYNRAIVDGANTLIRAGLDDCLYVGQGTSTIWVNPANDNRLSIDMDGKITV